MAELLGTVVAGAQAIDYCMQIYELSRKIYKAGDSQRKYEATCLQLMDTLEQIQASPYLRTPVIIQCTEDVLQKLTAVHTTLSRPRKTRWTSSVSFAFRQKHYDQLFAHLEQKKEIMALHIAQLNTNALGHISATLGTIEGKVECISQQSKHKGEPEPPHQIRPYLPAESLGEAQKRKPDEWHVESEDVTQMSSNCSSRRPSSITCWEEEAPSKDFGEVHEDRHGSWLQGNIQRTDGLQILGLDVCPGSTIADDDVLRITSNFRISNNIHMGKGSQVIGQRIRAGAKACQFSGGYCNNEHRGDGAQVVGILIE